MNVNNRIKSKMKLFEVTKKLNGISISESLNMNDEIYSTLITSMEALGAGELSGERGGNYTSNTQSTEEGYFVEIDGVDRLGNEYSFKFKIESELGVDDDVTQITNVDLTGFGFNSNDESEEILLDERTLDAFNKPRNVEYFNVITKYIDVDLESDIKEKQ